ncbi:MAG TPA: hypothetical protein VFC82_02820 [Actinomycetaceae bacterium]|nr:hypothetical protein [Actinomycetaceae bacterium]
MKRPTRDLQVRMEGLRLRVDELGSLRSLVQLPAERDISRRQWSVIESQLAVIEARLLARLKRVGRTYLPTAHEPQAAVALNALLGELELELARAYTFFDTYMDILTQRHPPLLGRLLAGCDVLAWDAINREHPALAIVEPPLVFCDRGFGAATIRESVKLPDGSPNPMPIIQIPYSRLKEKYNLTSVIHEVGHEMMVRLGLVRTLPEALRVALARSGASRTLQDYFALWSSEIGPDFWGFCASGVAAAGGIKEILALPPSNVFRVTWTDPHPPPYLRVLLVFEWCRRTWGADPVDTWQEEWREYYPLSGAPPEVRGLLRESVSCIPAVTDALFQTRFRVLNGRKIPDLFSLDLLAPARLRPIAAQAESGAMDLRGLRPSAQLAVFRLVKEGGRLPEEKLDRLMTSWLLNLAQPSGLSERPGQSEPSEPSGPQSLTEKEGQHVAAR